MILLSSIRSGQASYSRAAAAKGRGDKDYAADLRAVQEDERIGGVIDQKDPLGVGQGFGHGRPVFPGHGRFVPIALADELLERLLGVGHRGQFARRLPSRLATCRAGYGPGAAVYRRMPRRCKGAAVVLLGERLNSNG